MDMKKPPVNNAAFICFVWYWWILEENVRRLLSLIWLNENFFLNHSQKWLGVASELQPRGARLILPYPDHASYRKGNGKGPCRSKKKVAR